MKRSGGEVGRPFYHYSIDELEAEVQKIQVLNDAKALRAELGYRKSKRSAELDDLLARLIRDWTGSWDPKSAEVKPRKSGNVGSAGNQGSLL